MRSPQPAAKRCENVPDCGRFTTTCSVVRASRAISRRAVALRSTTTVFSATIRNSTVDFEWIDRANGAGWIIVRNLCSHGVGSALHEEPTDITGYHEPRDPRVMQEGMAFTIEPFLSTKARRAEDAGDGWTLVGPKGSVTAQYEHTLVVGRRGPIVVTDLRGLT